MSRISNSVPVTSMENSAVEKRTVRCTNQRVVRCHCHPKNEQCGHGHSSDITYSQSTESIFS